MTVRFGVALFMTLTLVTPLRAHASDAPRPLLRFPTASGEAVAFVAAGDLWIVPRSGGQARQLTDDPGQVLTPRFSPDGSTIAFTWRRGGLNDVWVVSAAGGEPRRLTHGPSLKANDNLVTGWSPDGGTVLFVSRRASPLGRTDVHAVPVGGGLARPLGLGHAGLASMASDGASVVYDWSFRNIGGDRWKRYRGGQAGELFLWNPANRRSERLTAWDGTDTAPMWVGKRIFFLSDRGPEQRLNLWVLDPATKAARQITRYTDYDVDLPSSGPGGIAFAYAGDLYLLDPTTEKVAPLPVRLPIVAAETPQVRSAGRYVVRADIAGQPGYAIGSDGTAYLSARGDVFALTPDGGWRNLTNTPESVEEYPLPSPDGRRLAMVSDANGEQQVVVLPLDLSDRPQTMTRFRSGVLYAPRWSPDGRHIVVGDANKQLWLITPAMGQVEQVAGSRFAEIHDAVFSPDSGRLAYSIVGSDQTSAIHVRDLASGRDVELSAPGESDREPTFTADGGGIVFVSARREIPFVSDRDREGTIATIGSDGIYRATLSPDLDPALFRASTAAVPVTGRAGFSHLAIRGRTLFYRETPFQGIGGELPGQEGNLRAVDLVAGTDAVLAPNATGYALAFDASAALVSSGNDFRIVPIRHPESGARALPLDALRITFDPAAERREMFEQAWRRDRDLFWDPAMNGVDWRAVHARYAPLVARARSHEDMIYLLGELQGELTTSHMFVGGGDSSDPRVVAPTSLLGVDFAKDGASGLYRFARIYRGDNSRARFRSPLGNPALGVEEGDYLIAVNGAPLRAPDDPYRLLANLHGPVRLTLARRPSADPRTITIEPIADETEIRKLDWIERNKTLVDRLGGGKVGYLYLSDFNALGSEDFLRQFYQQANRESLVVDVRDNGGGFTSQWVLDLLRRPQAGIFRNREGGVTTLPGAVAPRRLVALTSIFSASDGDQFPYFFRHWGMGKVIGQRTWGGVRGIKGPWRLIDGTSVTVPKDSLLTVAGAPLLENRGAQPDVVVDDLPSDRLDGRDRQLEHAVQVIQGERARLVIPPLLTTR